MPDVHGLEYRAAGLFETLAKSMKNPINLDRAGENAARETQRGKRQVGQ